jgi:hypothetical protein
MRGFVHRMHQAIWGGRQLAFLFASCAPETWLQSGSFFGSNPSFAHNVALNVYNDGCIVLFLCLAAVMLPLLWCVLRGLMLACARLRGSPSWGLRWSLFSALLIQWLFQPLLYSDQQMFVMGFVFLGFIVAEFQSQ